MARFDLSGWKFSEWFKGNWGTVKEVLKVGVPLVTIWLTTGSYWMTGFGVVLGKFILDTLHYLVKE